MVTEVQKISTQFHIFHSLAVKVTDYILHSMNTAIKKIIQVAETDMKMMLSETERCKRVYDSTVAIKVNTALHHLELFSSDVQVMEYHIRAANFSKTSQYALMNTLATAESLFVSLDAVRTVDRLGDTYHAESLFVSRDAVRTVDRLGDTYFPHLLWRNDSYAFCQTQYTSMMGLITRINILLSNVSKNWIQLNSAIYYDYKASDTWHELINNTQQVNNVITYVKDCSSEYKNVLGGLYETLKSNLDELKKSLQNDFNFNHYEVLDQVLGDLETINSTIASFEGLLGQYSRNKTTKLAIASSLTTGHRTRLGEALSGILSRIDSHAFEPLRIKMRNARVNIMKWLLDSLRAIGTLEPYFRRRYDDENRFQECCEMLYYPILDMDSPDILFFADLQYKKTVWPYNESVLTNLENRGAEKGFTEVLKSYETNLSIVMYDLQTRLSGTKRDTLTALDDLVADVQWLYQKKHHRQGIHFVSLYKLNTSM